MRVGNLQNFTSSFLDQFTYPNSSKFSHDFIQGYISNILNQFMLRDFGSINIYSKVSTSGSFINVHTIHKKQMMLRSSLQSVNRAGIYYPAVIKNYIGT